MVYQKLFIIEGVILTVAEIKSNENIDWTEDEYGNIFIDINNKKTVKIFQFPCCSDIGNQIFIAGQIVHTYYRRYGKCDNCDDLYYCNYCIGNTNNGNYDVDKILNSPVECINMCDYCNADNRDEFENCKVCNRKARDITPHFETKAFLKKNNIDKPIKYYYMLDDCLSCT